MAMVIATGLIGLVSTDKRGVSMAIRFSFFSLLKCSNMCHFGDFGVKKTYKRGLGMAISCLFGKNTLILQPLAASSVVGRRGWHIY